MVTKKDPLIMDGVNITEVLNEFSDILGYIIAHLEVDRKINKHYLMARLLELYKHVNYDDM